MPLSLPQIHQELLPFAFLAFVLLAFALSRWYFTTNQALNDSKPVQPISTRNKTLSSQPTHRTDSKTGDFEEQDIEMIKEPAIDRTFVKQTYEAFLVLDVEATCMPGTDFNYPNEIIVSSSQSLK
ncbi:hypothetical protein EUX98_g331 [Antrodiella citrinella]|uniref:Exonuclease domain-containing protein n=1 Tax=Antrodiella citrinella TaxID=2447956 RepID=A0A4S4N4A9_9APHY|nr:hypothetical protein EUX98_g331 [Antrodiella citrinella]